MREVPRNASTGEILDQDSPCDLPLVGFWVCGAIIIASRVLLGFANMYVLLSIKRATDSSKKRRTRGVAPLLDILNTVFVILFIGLAPVTSSRDGTSWILFGLSYFFYFVGSVFFITKLIRNRRRIEGTGSGSTSALKMPKAHATVREEWKSFIGITICWIGIFGNLVFWIIAAALGGKVIFHRIAIGFFCLTTMTAQTLAFRESVLTATYLGRHVRIDDVNRGEGVPNKSDALKTVTSRLLRTASVFLPVWLSSTLLLICLAVGVLPFFWYITFILLSMPVINAAAATAIFIRQKKKNPNGSSTNPPHKPSSREKINDSCKKLEPFVQTQIVSAPSVTGKSLYVADE